MDDETLRASMEFIKNCPEWMQNQNLIIACKTDRTGTMEKFARILAEYGVPTEKILPCVMDLTTVIIESGEKMLPK